MTNLLNASRQEPIRFAFRFGFFRILILTGFVVGWLVQLARLIRLADSVDSTDSNDSTGCFNCRVPETHSLGIHSLSPIDVLSKSAGLKC